MMNRNTLVRQAFVLNAGNLGRRVVRGAGFQFLGIVLRTLITIGSMAILARLLSPADFGYVAMAAVVTEFAALFSHFGFTNVLIQRRAITRLQLDTVFWASLGLGVVLAAATFVASFFATWLFSDPKVGPLLRVMSLMFVLSELTSVPWIVLARLMRFRSEFSIQISAIAIRAVAAVAFAWAGYGVWSLVAGGLVGGAVQAILGFAIVRFRPRWRFDSVHLVSTWRTSGSYFGRGLLYYVSMNADLMLIGRSLGATSLGFYQNARSLTDEIRARIAMPLQRVLFPAFSAVQGERERLQQFVQRSARLLAAIVIPIGFGVSANAPELVRVLYGEQWLAMIPVMSMFGLSAAFRAATAVASPLFDACNRVGLALRYNFVGTALTVTGIVIALPYGIETVAASVATTTLYSLVTFRVGIGLVGLGTRHMLRFFGPPTLASLVMWFATLGMRSLATPWIEHVAVLLLLHVAAGAVVYLVVLNLMSRDYLRELMRLRFVS